MKYSFSRSFTFHLVLFIGLIFILEYLPNIKNEFYAFFVFSIFSVGMGLLFTYYVYLAVEESTSKQTECIKLLFAATLLLYMYMYIYGFIVSRLNHVLHFTLSTMYGIFFVLLFLILSGIMYRLTSYIHSSTVLLLLALFYFLWCTYIAYYTIRISKQEQHDPMFTSTQYVIYFSKKFNEITYSLFMSLYHVFYPR
jgi:hypothetical protein